MNVMPLLVGVEINGLELDKPIAADVAAELRRLLSEQQLLVIRGQSLSPNDQIRVMQIFGTVLDEKHDGLRYQYVSGEKTSVKPGRLLFHSDNHFTQVPLELLSLYGEEVGERATPTLFASNVAAYQRLAPECRARLSSLEVINRSFFHLGLSDQPARELSPDLEGGPIARHPAVWQHPETGAPFVYLSEMHAFRLDGLVQAESDELLEEVFDTLYDPATVLEHKWADGDLVIWNNRTVQHARGPIDDADRTAGSARSIRRVSTGSITFTEQFQFTPEAIAAMGDFYQKSVTADN
jgi:taurine dioxygenase